MAQQLAFPGAEYGALLPDPWAVQGTAEPLPPNGEMAGGGTDPLAYSPTPPPDPASVTQIQAFPGTPPTFDPNADPLGYTAPPAAAPGAAPPPPVPSPGHADRAATQAAAAPPAPPGPGRGPDFVGVTESSTSTTGPDKETSARINEGLNKVDSAQAQADAGTVDLERFKAQQMQQQSERALATAAAGMADVAAKQAVQDHITEEVDRRLNAGGPNSKDAAGIGSAYWRPDPTELFHGDHGVLFGISAAVAAMAGAWMQGRGLTKDNQYLNVILKMIDDNVEQQVRQNSSAYQHLKDLKGDAKAAKLELRERQLAYATQQNDGLALRANSEIVQRGAGVIGQKLTAEREKSRLEQQKQLTKTVTNTVQRKMVANPANAALDAEAKAAHGERTPEQAKAQGAVDAINRYGTSAGLQRDANGKWVVGPGAFPPAALEKINPFSDNSIKADAEAAVESYGRLQSGGVIGDDEREAFREQLGLNTLTRAQLAAKLNAAQNALTPRVRSTDAANNQAASTIPQDWK